MIIPSQALLTDFLLPKADRTGNYFGHIMGTGFIQDYRDFLARLNQLSTDTTQQILLFKTALNKPNDIDVLIQEIKTLPIGNFTSSHLEFTRFDDFNTAIIQALDMIIPHAIHTEHFPNDELQNLFIAKLFYWIHTYLEPIDFSKSEVPKAIFYGPIKRQECYFILLLALVGFDTFYLNPTHDVTFGLIDSLGLSQTLILGEPAPFEDFDDLAHAGSVIDHITTSARHATDQLEAFMYTDSGLFKPWQFAKGTTKPLLLDAVLEDLETYWDEPSKLRPGFKTSGQVVYPPVFFTKIAGVHLDLEAYFTFVQKLCNSKHYVLYTQTHFASLNKVSSRDIYSLIYCLNPDKTINREALKAHVLYKHLLTFRSEVQTFILDKLDALLAPNAGEIFNFKITDKERSNLIALTLTLENQLLNLIDSYDFPQDIPKLILYINNRATFTTEVSMLLALLHTIGFDIILLCPNAANNIELLLSDQYIKTLRLPELAYDLQLRKPQPVKSKSFFNKFFR